MVASDTEEPYGAMSDDEYEEQQQALAPQPQPQAQQQQQAPRTMQRARQQRQVNNPLPQANNIYNQQMMAPGQEQSENRASKIARNPRRFGTAA
jgi:hypothetical protein